DAEFAGRFFSLAAAQVIERPPAEPDSRLIAEIDRQQAAIRRNISQRNARLFEEEATKLDGWADDLKIGLEREIKELDRLLKEARRVATVALTLEEKLAGQRHVKEL